ncbi:hypothetical protein KV112_04445 [Mycolicibacter sp. MYC123]|uniref:Uncharacterized protein n=1 Tax=[Mycobacterium] zoologicum TaxID=2872311 RepID=A0ABU5YJQ9_9MYCO|nr:hypothetical protein [Mycolicibacter sp. MYC123]MEB3048998.1 hypothetical protein [Mycolicibacter sp. MYC123]
MEGYAAPAKTPLLNRVPQHFPSWIEESHLDDATVINDNGVGRYESVSCSHFVVVTDPEHKRLGIKFTPHDETRPAFVVPLQVEWAKSLAEDIFAFAYELNPELFTDDLIT